jgi:hypothetical protein
MGANWAPSRLSSAADPLHIVHWMEVIQHSIFVGEGVTIPDGGEHGLEPDISVLLHIWW